MNVYLRRNGCNWVIVNKADGAVLGEFETRYAALAVCVMNHYNVMNKNEIDGVNFG